MKNVKRIPVLLLGVTILFTLLAGCGGKASESNGSTASVSTAPAADATTAAVSEAPAKKEVKGDIKYMFWGNTDQLAAIQKQVDQFKQTEPKVNINVDVADWGTYWTKLQTSTAAGDAPDTFAMSTTAWLPYYASKDFLLDMNPLSAADGFDTGKYSKAALGLSTYEGKLLGLPQDLNVIVMAYNTDMFTAAGVAPLTGDTTWDEVLAATQKLTVDEAGKNPTDPAFNIKKVKQWGFQNRAYYIDGFLDPVAYAFGGSFFKDGKPNVKDPNTKKAIQLLTDFVTQYHVAPDLDTSAEWDDQFSLKKAAMIPMPSYWAYQYADPTKDLGINYEIAPMPKATKDGKSYNAVQSKAISIYKGTKNVDAAWAFCKFICSDEQYVALTKEGRGLSPITAQLKDLYLGLDWGPKTTKQVMLDALEDPCPVPQINKLGDGNTAAATVISNILLRNKMPFDQAIDKMDADMNAAIQ